MRALSLLITGAIIGTIIAACGGGAQRPRYDKFPRLTADLTIWGECTGDKKHLVDTHVCKAECVEWKSKTECKKDQIIDMPFKEAIKKNYKMVHKSKIYEWLGL